jgi:adenylylsulfate kinase
MHRKILIMGLPGAGKTTLAHALAPRLKAVHFNADEVRREIHRDLGFSQADRKEHARRMGWLCDRVVKSGGFAIADFICPTPQTRAAFMEGGDAFIVWVDRITEGRFEDTNQMFVPPERVHLRIPARGSVEYWAEQVTRQVGPILDSNRPTAMFIGRFQPFHEGHRAVILEGLRRFGQVCIAVRDSEGTDANTPSAFDAVRANIEHALQEFEGRFSVLPIPNITHVFLGRDMGMKVIELADARSSAKDVRPRLAEPAL